MDWTDLEFFDSTKYQLIKETLKRARFNGKSILPDFDKVFRALELTPFDQTKVVILGQDPYSTNNYATGLAFSVHENTNPVPRSLQNIFKELKEDIGTERTNGDLVDWAQQGVLLLNTSLTVVKNKPGSHSKLGWMVLVNEMINALNEQKKNVVFVLWGNHAGKKKDMIDREKHLVITSAHPSPLSAYQGFFGSRPFSRCNKYLTDNNIKPINW